ncbi:CD36 family protein, partial [Candidatus Poseidonia alphae]|nr:CD36 family protein [Candidatus Poseidonia alphae]
MVTPTSPKNMLIAGIILILLNVAALSPLSTGAVEGAVDDNFETFPKDSACYDDDCEEAEDDWASSTSQRDFYGWSVNNLDDVMANGSAPTYTEVGPVTYDITTTKTINSYDKEAGTLTYNSVKTFECNADSEVSCDHEVTQLNIAFQTQVIGATGMAINGIMDATKAGFTTGMLAKDLESLGAGSAASQAMSGLYAQTVTDVTAMGGTEAMANAGIGAGFYDGWNQYFALMNLSQMNNLSGQGETINYTAVSGATSNFSNLTYAFTEALMPGSGEDVSLLSSVGTMVFAGHCDAYPTSPENATVRAQIWQYLDTNEAATIANDYAMCFGIGGNFASTFGGGDATLGVGDTTGMAVNVSTRLGYLGITMDEMSATVMLFGDGDDVITGLLEVNDAGTEFGVANFLGMDGAAAMTAYGMDQATYESVYGWAASWFGDVTSLPMILLGGSGDMTASLFVNTTFGAEDPLNGGYLANSLNLGGGWAALGASGGNAVDLDPALSGNALYGPLGLTTSTGSAIFLYGELSGFTPPLNFSTNPPTPGAPMAWDENTIAALYGVDTNAANAMRALMMGPIYGTTSESFVPGFLMSSFGATPYLTQSFNSWLLGWHDPVSAFLATGNPMDMSAGWASLETNATYYGSAGIANGDGTNYTMCTGEVDTCDKGETLLEDGSTQLSWRNDAMFAATFGLIAPESLVNTTGGFVTGTGDLVDVSGYAIAEITCDGTGTVKNIPVDVCTATVDATKRSIQANLLETYSLLDATPGALPVYFGSNITMEAEQLSGLIIAGESTSTFYLDTRA